MGKGPFGITVALIREEDLQKVYPIAVDIDEETGEVMDWNMKMVVPPMLALIQEQKKEIDSIREELDDIKKLFFYTACQSVAYKLWIDYGYSPESALHYVDKSSDIFLRYVLKNQYSIHHFENYQKVREDFDVFTATFEYNFCINSYHNSVSVGDVDFGFEAGHSDAYSEDVRAHLEAQERSKLVKSPLLIYRVSGNRHPYS